MLTMRGESLRKPLADLDEARIVGRFVERALVFADITKQDAAFRLGYSDQSAVSRWVAGVETPQLAKLWTLGRRFRTGFLLAVADACSDDGARVSHVVTVPEERSA